MKFSLTFVTTLLLGVALAGCGEANNLLRKLTLPIPLQSIASPSMAA